MPMATPPTVFIWDYETSRVKDYQIAPLVRKVRDTVGQNVGRVYERAFLVCCDVRNLSSGTSRAINRIRNIDLVHVDSNQANAADEKIKQKLHQFDIDFRDEPGVIVLISGNDEFGYFLSNMSRSGWQVILFHPPLVSKEFLDCVDYHHDMSRFIVQIDKDATITKPPSKDLQKDAGYLLVTNLPVNEMTCERMITHLHMATEDCFGTVTYYNQMTGEAVVTYYPAGNDTKGTTAVILAKNCKLVFGSGLNALAIKDPSAELARMKFTVQQVGVDGAIPHPGNWADHHPKPRSSRASSSVGTTDLISPSSGVSSLASTQHSSNGRVVRVEKLQTAPAEDDYEDESDYHLADDEYPPLPENKSDGQPCYAAAVKRQTPSVKHPNHPNNNLNGAPRDQAVSNSYRPYFQKPAMQCFHWDNPQHLNQGAYECKFWHPRERCRFYPNCMMGADACGYAHPFCGVYCECESSNRDAQKNHRLNPPSYIKNKQPETAVEE
uniref:NYN domain-containing protein n=1 Tax=Plectus sambesii TaxID=2011161 RepID=A0A914VJQ9_9BILA